MYPTQDNSHALDLEPDGDFDYADDNEDVEHHHFLDGHPALKFLLAGGIAGAGTFSFPTRLSLPFESATFSSFSDMHSTVRPAESIPNNQATRTRRRDGIKRTSKNNRRQGYSKLHSSHLRRRRSPCILGWKWIVCCKNLPGISHQIFYI